MENLILLPTAKMKGIGQLGIHYKGLSYLSRPRLTAMEMLKVEKRVMRGVSLPVANDSSFVPAPGAA